MSDLDAFFKKKAEKKKKNKNKGVMDINTLAETLQQARVVDDTKDDDATAAEKAAAQEEFRQLRKAEDSEWHDYVESSADLEGAAAVKALDYEEKVEEEEEAAAEVEKAEAAASEPHAAPWAAKDDDTAAEDEEEENLVPQPDPATAEPVKSSYVPPSQRLRNLGFGMGPTAIAPDLGNEELFPTLDVADQKEKLLQAELKKVESAKAKSGPGAKAKTGKEAEAGWSEPKRPSVYRPGMMKGTTAAVPIAPTTNAKGQKILRIGSPPKTGPNLPSAPAQLTDEAPTPAPPPATSAWGRSSESSGQSNAAWSRSSESQPNAAWSRAPESQSNAAWSRAPAAADTGAWRASSSPSPAQAPAPAAEQPKASSGGSSYVPPHLRGKK